jgi:hypothetical protein
MTLSLALSCLSSSIFNQQENQALAQQILCGISKDKNKHSKSWHNSQESKEKRQREVGERIWTNHKPLESKEK